MGILDMASPNGPQVDQNWLANYLNAQNSNAPATPVMTPFGNPAARAPASTPASTPILQMAQTNAAAQSPGASPAAKATAAASTLRGSKVQARPALDPNTVNSDLDILNKAGVLDDQKAAIQKLQSMYDANNAVNLSGASWVKPLLALSDQLTKGHLADSDTTLSPQQIAQQMNAQADEIAKRKQDTAKDNLTALSTLLKAPTGSVTNVYGNTSASGIGPQDKYFQMAQNALNSVRGDKTLNQAKFNHLLASNVNELVAKYGGDLDKMDPNSQGLLRDEIVKMATGGMPTMAAEHGIDPDTVKQGLAVLQQKLTNSPVGAGGGDFNKNFVNYANGLDKVATKNVQARMSQILQPFKPKLNSDDYSNFNKNYVQDPFGENNLNPGGAPAAATPTINDADVQAYAKKYNIPPAQALARKIAHGG